MIVIVTGASKGIGLSTANYLHDKGFTVIGTSRTPDKYNTNFKLLPLDVTDEESIDNLINTVHENYGPIDVIINNAGFGIVGSVETSTIDDYKKQMETNFYGAVRINQRLIPEFKKRGSGLIINVGSFGGRISLPYQSHYSASKAALAMYSDALRVEMMRFNVQVCLVEPGDTKTSFDTGRVNASNFDPDKDEVAKRTLTIYRNDEHNGTNPDKLGKLMYKIIKKSQKSRVKPRYLTDSFVKLMNYALRLFPYSLQERVFMMIYKIPRK